MKLGLFCLSFLFTTAPCSAQAATSSPAVVGNMRDWTMTQGKVFPAALRGIEGGKVTLVSPDGRTATLELAGLSRNDRDYVRGKMGAVVQSWLWQAAGPEQVRADRSGWPTAVRAPQESLQVRVVRPFAPGKGMKFASGHFEFECGTEVPLAELRAIAAPFEVIHEVWRLAPWGIITRPKAGLFQVELFLHTAAYEAAGAPPNSGCHFDQRAKKLYVLGSAIGLDPERTPLWRDEQSPVPALAYAVVPLLTQNLATLIPEWMVPSLALALRDLPVLGDTAWPGELLTPASTSAPDTMFTESEVRLYLQPADTSADPPLDREKLQKIIDYFIRGDGSSGTNLGTFLAAAAADQPLWDAFYQRLQERKAAQAKAKSDPAVAIPAMLPVPHDIDDPARVRYFHLPKLLGTPDMESGLRKAISALISP